MKSQSRVQRSSETVKREAASQGPALVKTRRTVAHPPAASSARAQAEAAQVGLMPPEPEADPGLRAANPSPVRRIGYVLDRFPQASHDFVRQEILALERLGFEVHIFSLSGPDGRVDDMTAALAQLRDPVNYFHARRQAEDAIGSNGSASETTSVLASWIAEQLPSARIEHLHAHLSIAPTDVLSAVRRLTGVPYSFTAHAEGLYENADRRTLREKVEEAAFVVTLFESDRGHLLRSCGAEVGGKIRSIPMGIDLEEWRFAAAESHDSDSVLAVGPLVEKSRFADLIEAISMLRDRDHFVRLTIAGEGELERELDALVERRRLHDRVTWVGATSRRELAMLMRTHTVMALPWIADHRDRDARANLVLQAMAVGLVVISTDMPGIREMIDDGMNGRLIMPRDPLWLSGAIETLLDNPGLRARTAAQARAKVERRFSAARNISDLARLFNEAAPGTSRDSNASDAAGA